MTQAFEGTINTVTDPAIDSSPVADPTTASNPDGINGEPSPGTQPAAAEPPATEKPAGDNQEPEGKTEPEDDKLDRFDKHPRFQELIKQNKEFKAQLAELTEKLKAPPAPATPPKDFESDLKALDKQLEDGDIGLAEYQQKSREIAKEQSKWEMEQREGETQRKAEAAKLQAKFLEEFPFVASLTAERTDEIAALKAANPLHDDVSAAMALHIKGLQEGQDAAVKAAVDKAVKETEDKLRKEFEAKRTTKSLGAGPATPPAADDPLKDTKAQGGLRIALASKLAGMRQAS